jgi:hypothetical protein
MYRRVHVNSRTGPNLLISLTFLLQVTYVSGLGRIHGMSLPMASSTIPIATAIVDVDSGEYFTSISGTTLRYAGGACGVASLTFKTNTQSFGPVGIPGNDTPFEVQGPVHAFHGAVKRGNETEILTAIGFWRLPAGKWLVWVAERLLSVDLGNRPYCSKTTLEESSQRGLTCFSVPLDVNLRGTESVIGGLKELCVEGPRKVMLIYIL